MDAAAQPATPEVSIVKSFQAQRGRLIYKLEYKPLRSLGGNGRPSVPKGALAQLEQGLREVLTTVNLDVLLNVGTQLAAEANRHLKALCNKLEGLVNPFLVPLGDSPAAGLEAGLYTRLEALIGILQRDDWKFDLVAGDQPERTLFQVPSQDIAVDADGIVDELNCFFKGLHQPSIQEMLPQKKPGIDQEELERALRLHNPLKAPFEKLLHALQESSPDVTREKHILVQLVDSGHAMRESFHLFLSSCGDSNRWLEVQLESAPPE